MTPDDRRPPRWLPRSWLPRYWARSLRARLLLFLSIALLPLGVIAVFQTLQVIEETRRLAGRDAVARTAQAAEAHQVVLQRAFGAARALGQAAARLPDDPALCSAIMADFVAGEADFVFAGFVDAGGTMACNDAGTPVAYAGRTDWEAFMADPAPNVTVNPEGEVSGQSVYIVFVPIFAPETGALLGGQAISIPHALPRAPLATGEAGLELALLDAGGTILASSTGMDDLGAYERRGVVPEALDIPPNGRLIAPGPRTRFDRPSAVVPLIDGQIYVLGLWQPGGLGSGVSAFTRSVPVFPLLMWLASLAVAYTTVSNLILAPLARLAREMHRYRPERPGDALVVLAPDAPSEIAAIASTYNRLLERVAADHARLEAAVTERETLLREVHHRVKNNLQLISSILNMQMRGVTDKAARHILSRVQDRVMSLSSVHRALYTDDQVQSVRADHLLDAIVGGLADLTARAGTRVEIDVALAPVRLDPDQAVPLALLATEALTNAVKHLGPDAQGRAAIDVSLQALDTGQIAFGIRNTCASPDPGAAAGPEPGAAPADPEGTSLGARLIRSFASQLGGTLEIDATDTAYDLRLRFDRHPTD
jgi:two-component sensor histidine kinase